MTSEVGSITASGARVGGSSMGTIGSYTDPCRAGLFSGMSILRFGKSLPLLELFETFMITGVVTIAMTSATYFTFHNIADILKTEGGSPSSVNMAIAAAHTQPVWIGIGVLILFIGVIMYYVHRRVVNSPS